MSNNKLTKQQKKAIFLVAIGTLLEYFDLTLYVHMSTLLNGLFFPQSDPMIAQILGAVAFCTTYFLRPIGGIIIGKIGDSKGRKATITITTLLMATACLIMAGTPEYREIGITATIMIIVARALQGFSSLGEKVGAFLYMSEILKVPYKCVAAGMMGVASQIGMLIALTVASVALSTGINWRWAFILGAFIAVIGIFARLRLRETPEFVNYKLRVEKKIKLASQNIKKGKDGIIDEKLNIKTVLAYFFTEVQSPICYYIVIVYLGEFMKKILQMTPAEVATHNLKVSTIMTVVVMSIVTYLVKKFHPIKIALISSLSFIATIPFVPYWLSSIARIGSGDAWFSLFCLQSLLFSIHLSTWGTLDAIQYKYFPVSKRFTSMATTFGIASSLGYAFVVFSLIPLTYYFGYYALWLILIPVLIGYLWALFYFRKLEIERGLYYDYPCEEPGKPDTIIEDHRYDNEDYFGDEYKPFKRACEYSSRLLSRLSELSIEMNKKLNMNAIKYAVAFAKKWHDGQMRKTGDHPFYSHPLKVAEMVAEKRLKTDIVIGAILHDVVEDSECTVELIEEKFNKRIAQMVDRLTKIRFENGKYIKLSLEETLKRLMEVGDDEALFIKQMDRQHNLETIEGLKPEKQKKMAEETTNYFIRLIAIIGDKLNIYGKVQLENKMSRSCDDILRSNKDKS